MTFDSPAALADTINLTPADVPGYTPTPHSAPPAAVRAREGLLRCAGAVSRGRALVDVYSDDFHQMIETSAQHASHVVTSEVIVWPSAAIAERDRVAIGSERFRTCVPQFVVAEAEAEIVDLVVSELTAAAREVAGLRVTTKVDWAGRRMTSDADFFTLWRGQLEVMLTTVTSAPPFPEPEQHRLLELLLKRAQQHVR